MIPTANLDVAKRKIFVPSRNQTPNSSYPAHTLVTELTDWSGSLNPLYPHCTKWSTSTMIVMYIISSSNKTPVRLNTHIRITRIHSSLHCWQPSKNLTQTMLVSILIGWYFSTTLLMYNSVLGVVSQRIKKCCLEDSCVLRDNTKHVLQKNWMTEHGFCCPFNNTFHIFTSTSINEIIYGNFCVLKTIYMVMNL